MLTRLTLAIVVSAAVGAPRAAMASPITYDFSGTLNQPIGGTNQFSGSFTVDTAPNALAGLPNWNGPAFAEEAGQVSMSVNLGGKTLNITNTAEDPTNAFFQGALGTTGQATTPTSQVLYSIQGSQGTQSLFSLSLSRPGSALALSDLSKLASSSYTANVKAMDPSGATSGWISGSITSISEVSTPEPSTLAVFGAMALAALARRRFRRS